MTGKIIVHRRADRYIGEIVIDNPGKSNAITAAMVAEFCAALDAFERDNDVKVIVISGSGPDLTVGSDVDEIARRFEKKSGDGRERPVNQRVRFDAANLWWGPHGLYRRVLHCPKVTILAAKGLCFEAGLYLATYCDLTIAAETAVFANPHWQHLGVNGDISMLVAAVGLKRAKDLVYTGARWSARDAVSFGLIDGVTAAEQHDQAIETLANSCAMIMRDAVASEKQIIAAALARMQIDTGFGAAAVLGAWSTNIHFRDGEFNLLREMKQIGRTKALHKSDEHFKG